MSQDLFDILSDASQNSSLNPLLFYIVEIITALTQLNLAFQSVDYYKKNLDGWVLFYPPTGEHRVNENGQMRLLSAAENKENIWNNFLRKQCAATITPVNIYIKTVKTLENKIALLINKKENLGQSENEITPKSVREDTISDFGQKILSFFKVQLNIKKILRHRHEMEHRKSKMNQIILFFLNKKSPEVEDFKIKIKELSDFVKIVHESHSDIYNILVPQLFVYLGSEGAGDDRHSKNKFFGFLYQIFGKT